MRRLLALLVTALLLLGACGSDKKKVATSSKGATTTAVGTATTAVEAGGTTAVNAPKAGTTKKSGASNGGSASAAGPQQSTPAGVKAAAPGTYTYKVTGTQQVLTPTPQPINTTATMKMDPLQGTDQHNSQSVPQGTTETLLRYQADGVYLLDLKLSGTISKEFKLDPPGLSLAQPAAVGRTWSWSATSTDGKTTVKSDFKILRTETIQIGSEQVPAVVIDATVVTDGDFKSTSKRTIWTSEAYRLIVRQDDKTNGTYGGYNFAFDTSSVLQSTKPT